MNKNDDFTTDPTLQASDVLNQHKDVNKHTCNIGLHVHTHA